MKFEYEWQEAQGVRDKVLAATWARLSLKVGDLCASEAIDLRSDSRRLGIYGSLFPLTEWLIENWWHLLYEMSPYNTIPSGRTVSTLMRDWVRRHNLLSARDGGALPDLTIVRDGNEINIQWQVDTISSIPARIRFVGQGKSRINAEIFEELTAKFIDAVLMRLIEKFNDNEEVNRVVEAWNVIRNSDSEETDICRYLAVMGVDPYDPDEATDNLVQTILHSIQILPGELCNDFFEGTEPQHLDDDLTWIKQTIDNFSVYKELSFPLIEFTSTSTAYETGYKAARRVRSELLGLTMVDPVLELGELLVKHLGWDTSYTKTSPGNTRLDGIVGFSNTNNSPIMFISAPKSERADRFRLARALFFPVTGNLNDNKARLITGAVTPLQRASRAFAAELLAPAEALAKRVSRSLNDHDVDKLASEFVVNSQVIRHQVENHDLAYIES